MSNKEKAIRMWKRYGCGKGVGCGCGPGSTLKASAPTRRLISVLINKYSIKSIGDAACGSFSWMSRVQMDDIEYTGYDINNPMIEKNQKKYPNVNFEVFDIVHEILPKSDLIVCRDCLFHLPTEMTIKTIDNFRQSGSRFLLATYFPSVKKNKDVHNPSTGYGFRKINLCRKPFLLGNPKHSLAEPLQKRRVGAWEL